MEQPKSLVPNWRAIVSIPSQASMCSDTFVLPFRSNEKFLNQPYRFRGLFTWHGCVVELEGKCHAYIADETPNVIYLNTHAILQERREAAKIQKTAGPRVCSLSCLRPSQSLAYHFHI
jgi:hypothetical protein